MTTWDGRGLPPAAAARMARYEQSQVRTSLLSVPAVAALADVGFSPVGEVMGSIVQHIGWAGWGGCGVYGYGTQYLTPGTVTSGAGAGFGGYRPYVDALYRGYDTAQRRMLEEARAMRADGVVGTRVTVADMGEGNREFVMLGTAVQAASRARPNDPFTTDLAGEEVAKLLRAGWVPVRFSVGISVGIRHDDYVTQRQTSAWNQANTEIAGYTELVTYVRADARHRFFDKVRVAGADGAVVSGMTLSMWEIEPSEGHRDHVAESTVTGTSIARFHLAGPAATSSLAVLPLRTSLTEPAP